MLTVVLFIVRRRLAADGTNGDVRHVNVGLGGRAGHRRQQADSINPVSAAVRVLKYMSIVVTQSKLLLPVLHLSNFLRGFGFRLHH